MYSNKHQSQVTHPKKSPITKDFSQEFWVKQQIDTLYDVLGGARGALIPIANTLLNKKFLKPRVIRTTHRRLAHESGYKSRTTGFVHAHTLAHTPFMIMKRVRVQTEDGMRDEAGMYELNPLLFTPYALKKLGSLLPALKRFLCASYLTSQKFKSQTCTHIKNFLKQGEQRYDFLLRHTSVVNHSCSFYDKKEELQPPVVRESSLEDAITHLESYIDLIQLERELK